MDILAGSLMLILIVSVIVIADNRKHLLKEYYYLRSYKILNEEPNAKISPRHREGRYFVTYHEGGHLIYKFFKRRSEQVSEINAMESEGKEIKHGLRTTEYPLSYY